MSKYFDSQNLTFMSPEVKENGRHMVLTNVHKESKTKYLNIDTRFQNDYSINEYAEFNSALPQTLTNVKSMKVTNVEIPLSFYNFSHKRKNTFLLLESENYDPINIIIDEGNPDIVDILSQINSVSMSNLSLTLTDNNKIRMSNNGGYKIKIFFNVDMIDAVTQELREDNNNLKSKLGWQLGFREPFYELNANTHIFSESIPLAFTFSYFYLSIDDFSQTKPESFIVPSSNHYINSNTIARISIDPTSYEFGYPFMANISGGRLLSDTRTYGGKTDIQRLKIKLLDEFGKTVDLNKMDFSFVLEVVHE